MRCGRCASAVLILAIAAMATPQADALSGDCTACTAASFRYCPSTSNCSDAAPAVCAALCDVACVDVTSQCPAQNTVAPSSPAQSPGRSDTNIAIFTLTAVCAVASCVVTAAIAYYIRHTHADSEEATAVESVAPMNPPVAPMLDPGTTENEKPVAQ